MSERKSINKYFPSEYEAGKEKHKQAKKVEPTVRLMLPFSMVCLKCSSYIPNRRKFNARKKTTGEDYLGIKIIRFTFRCPQCNFELTFETDPKNGDFKCVDGCRKNYEKKDVAVPVKENVQQMIERLEKEAEEELLQREKANKSKMGVKDAETAIEQLEYRLEQQEKERILGEQLEDIQENQLKQREAEALISKRKIERDDYDEEQEAKRAFKGRDAGQFEADELANKNSGKIVAKNNTIKNLNDNQTSKRKPGVVVKSKKVKILN